MYKIVGPDRAALKHQMATLALGAPVPGLIWSSLEDVLQANMRRLAKDIAATLGQPEAPLLQAIRATTIRPYIFEEAESEDREVDMRCECLCQPPSSPLFIQRCGKPVLWSATGPVRRCAEHAYSAPVSYSALPKLRALEPVGEEKDKYFVSEDGTVYNIEYTPVGTYDTATNRLTLFIVSQD
jgi:hypothetical protein